MVTVVVMIKILLGLRPSDFARQGSVAGFKPLASVFVGLYTLYLNRIANPARPVHAAGSWHFSALCTLSHDKLSGSAHRVNISAAFRLKENSQAPNTQRKETPNYKARNSPPLTIKGMRALIVSLRRECILLK